MSTTFQLSRGLPVRQEAHLQNLRRRERRRCGRPRRPGTVRLGGSACPSRDALRRGNMKSQYSCCTQSLQRWRKTHTEPFRRELRRVEELGRVTCLPRGPCNASKTPCLGRDKGAGRRHAAAQRAVASMADVCRWPTSRSAVPPRCSCCCAPVAASAVRRHTARHLKKSCPPSGRPILPIILDGQLSDFQAHALLTSGLGAAAAEAAPAQHPPAAPAAARQRQRARNVRTTNGNRILRARHGHAA